MKYRQDLLSKLGIGVVGLAITGIAATYSPMAYSAEPSKDEKNKQQLENLTEQLGGKRKDVKPGIYFPEAGKGLPSPYAVQPDVSKQEPASAQPQPEKKATDKINVPIIDVISTNAPVLEPIEEIKVLPKPAEQSYKGFLETRVNEGNQEVRTGITIEYDGFKDILKGIGGFLYTITQPVHLWHARDCEVTTTVYNKKGGSETEIKTEKRKIWAPFWRFFGKGQSDSLVGVVYDESKGFVQGWKENPRDKVGKLAGAVLVGFGAKEALFKDKSHEDGRRSAVEVPESRTVSGDGGKENEEDKEQPTPVNPTPTWGPGGRPVGE